MNEETSSELAFRRRLALLASLHRQPLRYDEIIATLDNDGLFAYDQAADPAKVAQWQLFQFRNDLQVLRRMHCDIRCDRKSQRYCWYNSPFQLSLKTAELTSFALLLETFMDATLLHAADIQALLTSLLARLPTEQQKVVQSQRPSYSIVLQETTDYRNADSGTVREIEKAIEQGLQLEFVHRRPRDGQEKRHVIEPRPLRHESGHVYLYGWSIDFDKELRFRLDYIVSGSARRLHTSAIPARPTARSYVLCYYLSPIIARNRVSQNFAGQQVEMHEDGSATVTARITDLFKARQTLLKYGENCVILGPPELLEQMRVIRDHYLKNYPTPEE